MVHAPIYFFITALTAVRLATKMMIIIKIMIMIIIITIIKII